MTIHPSATLLCTTRRSKGRFDLGLRCISPALLSSPHPQGAAARAASWRSGSAASLLPGPEDGSGGASMKVWRRGTRSSEAHCTLTAGPGAGAGAGIGMGSR